MEITVCIGSSCHLRGSREIIDIFTRLIEQGALQEKVELKGSFCMGNCEKGVCVGVDGEVFSVSPDTAAEFFETHVLAKL